MSAMSGGVASIAFPRQIDRTDLPTPSAGFLPLLWQFPDADIGPLISQINSATVVNSCAWDNVSSILTVFIPKTLKTQPLRTRINPDMIWSTQPNFHPLFTSPPDNQSYNRANNRIKDRRLMDHCQHLPRPGDMRRTRLSGESPRQRHDFGSEV